MLCYVWHSANFIFVEAYVPFMFADFLFNCRTNTVLFVWIEIFFFSCGINESQMR